MYNTAVIDSLNREGCKEAIYTSILLNGIATLSAILR